MLGCGQSITHATISSMPDLTCTPAPSASGEAAYAHGQARRRRTSTCWRSTTPSRSTRSCSSRTSASARRARAGASSRADASAPKGSLAVNTNGGGLSYCHPGMYGLFLLIEAVRQIARRMRRAPGAGRQDRARARQRRRAVVAGHGHPGWGGGVGGQRFRTSRSHRSGWRVLFAR